MERLFYYMDQDLFIHHTLDRCPDPGSFPMHAHERMEIFCFLSGHASYSVEGTQYSLRPNDVLLMRHAEAHKLLIQPDEPYERIAIHFSPQLLAAQDPEGRFLRPFLNRPLGQENRYDGGQPELAAARNLLLELDTLRIPPYELRLHAIACLLLMLCGLSEAWRPGSDESGDGDLSTAAQLAAYINDHLFEDISLDTLCGTFFLSKSQINRIFAQATGTSVWRYITIKRLLAARAMIRDHEPAGQVCLKCGFNDYSSFYRAYKTKFGCSPINDAKKV